MGVVIQEFEVSPLSQPAPPAPPPAAEVAAVAASAQPIDGQGLLAECRARALRLFAH
ncbi:MAG: hypothetical protein V5B32_15015 [Candidatus Accumulibacter sp. UW26]|jgi:hypothetical protein